MAPRVTADHLDHVNDVTSHLSMANLRMNWLDDLNQWHRIFSIEVILDLLAEISTAAEPTDEKNR
jgi:hypothetical protein